MNLQPGDKVTYCPSHGKQEQGIVKSLNELNPESVFVVYNCAGDWENYTNFTAASTDIRDLKKGWLSVHNPEGKKYILIQNEGEIESNAFELIGASTKRGQSGKVGFFGSGSKYSIAYMMRNGIDFKVFSGERELIFSTIPAGIKDKSFDRICIDGRATSYTVTMGPTWTQDWFVLREIFCNAIDEGGCQLIKETENINSVPGKTRIYIEITDSLKKVCENWISYFADERDYIFKTEEIYTSSVGQNDVGGCNTQEVKVYDKTEGVLFRRGIRVYSNQSFIYDYGLEFVNINEDRTATDVSLFDYAICSMIASFQNEAYIKNVLRSGATEKASKEYECLTDVSSSFAWSDKWVSFSNDNMLVVRENSGKFEQEISITKREVFYIPRIFCRELKRRHPDVKIFGMGTLAGNISFDEISMTSKMIFLLKEVLAALKQMDYSVDYEIKAADIDNDTVLGLADKKSNSIIIAAKTFDLGRREIAMTIMEENEHLKSGHNDETRAFQTHLFSQWLKTMENANGLFL